MNERPTDTVLIGGGFFGYAHEICKKLEERGRSTTWAEDRPSLDTYTKIATRLMPSLVRRKADSYFDGFVDLHRQDPIRDVLVIKGESLSVAAIRKMKIAWPNSRFILYFWDSYRNMPRDSYEKVALFDRAFTFDPVDAQMDARLTYRPLFFLDEYSALPNQSTDIDLLFIGTAHSDRYAILQRLASNAPRSTTIHYVLYCPSKVIYWMRRLFDTSFWGAKASEFTFDPLGKREIQALLSRAACVVDIERAVQCGLTMRSIETLGAGKKLITTNARIMAADFYNEANIAVIDRRDPAIPDNFLDRPYIPTELALLNRYSLPGWLDEVLPDYPRDAGNKIESPSRKRL